MLDADRTIRKDDAGARNASKPIFGWEQGNYVKILDEMPLWVLVVPLKPVSRALEREGWGVRSCR